MRHCPECRRVYPPRFDVCPDCWATVQPGAPPERRRLSLVYVAEAVCEADMLASLLYEEGIPCLRLPAHGALPMPWGMLTQPGTRLYVRADMAVRARTFVAEVMGSNGNA